MKKSINTLKHTLGLSAVVTCSALFIGCAGNSPKPAVSVSPEPAAETTAVAEQTQPVSEQSQLTQTQIMPDENPAVLNDSNVPESDIVATLQPEQLTFQFGFDKAELGAEDKEIIKQHAKYLRAHPEVMVKVIGHTDHHGPKAYNEYLSKKRAEAVSVILLAEGVTESQIEIKALANENPLETAQHARENRRVELQFEEMNLVSK